MRFIAHERSWPDTTPSMSAHRLRMSLLIGLTLALGCAGSARAGAGFRIVIVPRGGSPSAFTWSFASPRVPGCPVGLGPALAEPNAWNLRPAVRGGGCIPTVTAPGASTGGITWSSNARGLSMSAAIEHTQRRNPLTPVAAYPELVYGWSPFLGIASRQAPVLRFPIAVGRLVSRRVDPVLSTDYHVCGSCLSRGPIDLSYDLWVSPNRSPRWCGHGATPPPGCVPIPSDAIEVMIWLAHSAAFHPAGTPGPSFSPYGWLDGRPGRLRFGTYVCGSCSHDLVSFVLAGARGLLQGSVALRLDDFLARASARRGYLDGIEFGSEIAPAHEGAPTRFWFDLRGYCLSSRAYGCP
jgi:hypothetical protein